MYVEVGTQLELSVVNLLGFFLTKFGTETALGPVSLMNRYYIIFVSQLWRNQFLSKFTDIKIRNRKPEAITTLL